MNERMNEWINELSSKKKQWMKNGNRDALWIERCWHARPSLTERRKYADEYGQSVQRGMMKERKLIPVGCRQSVKGEGGGSVTVGIRKEKNGCTLMWSLLPHSLKKIVNIRHAKLASWPKKTTRYDFGCRIEFFFYQNHLFSLPCNGVEGKCD